MDGPFLVCGRIIYWLPQPEKPIQVKLKELECPPHSPSLSPTRRLSRWCAVALQGFACWVSGHSVLASLQPAGYGHTLLVQSLFGAALSSTLLGLTRQSS
nr:hypothetical protein [uncultured bacterium]